MCESTGTLRSSEGADTCSHGKEMSIRIRTIAVQIQSRFVGEGWGETRSAHLGRSRTHVRTFARDRLFVRRIRAGAQCCRLCRRV